MATQTRTRTERFQCTRAIPEKMRDAPGVKTPWVTITLREYVARIEGQTRVETRIDECSHWLECGMVSRQGSSLVVQQAEAECELIKRMRHG